MSEMDTTEVGDVASPATDNRRKSGRVVKKPEVFAPSHATKRKRDSGADDDEDDDVDMEDDEDASSDDEGDDEEPDEEELRERRRNKRKAAARKPSAKKPKANGAEVNLAIRPAKSKKSRRPRPRQSALADGEGLYGMRTMTARSDMD